MTVKELKSTLEKYNNSSNVKVVMGRKVRPLDNVSFGVDLETNELYVWLCSKEGINEG